MTTQQDAPARPSTFPALLRAELAKTLRERTAPGHGTDPRHAAKARRRPVEPLLRNGHMLAGSALLSAALGAVFWVLATRWYSPETVGRCTATLSVAGLLSGLGRFNLGDVLTRFVPTAGRHTRWLVLRCYAVSIGASGLAAVGFLFLVPWISPELAFLRDPLPAAAFLVATAGYSVFVLQDGALTGLRRTGWVLGENALFNVVKAVLLGLCAALAVSAGILVAWSLALLAAIAVTSTVLFRHAIPAHQRADRAGAPRPRRVLGYATADYFGKTAAVACGTAVPLLVLGRLGAGPAAYYALAYIIADTFYAAVTSMGGSLVVEGVRDPARLAEYGRRMLRHATALVALPTLAVTAAAPLLLLPFGTGYAEHGTTVLRLMALSALPNVVLGVAVEVARVRRALRTLLLLEFGSAGLVLALVAVLLPPLGLTGVGLAWLIAACALAVPLLATLPRWLPAPPRRPA
ncbi:lipopolysaccharide biosynthesis protein [Kitasatospora sp. NPDC088391]|uniref:lipopolysaccharide biosynthesis protein n=1 Tax=Kitasatospora sp. NPDC088391 TaxID=3364074 RepID=UPI0038197725